MMRSTHSIDGRDCMPTRGELAHEAGSDGAHEMRAPPFQ